MNNYEGFDNSVTVNGSPLALCQNIYNHSSEFAWGYSGSGPSQLALAIIVNEFGSDLNHHPCHYQDFKFEVVAGLPERFKLTSEDIHNWLKGRNSR